MKNYTDRKTRLELNGFTVERTAICADSRGDNKPFEVLYPLACAVAYKAQEKVQYYSYSKVINARLKEWYVDGFITDIQSIIANNDNGTFDYFGALADKMLTTEQRKKLKLACTIKVMNKYRVTDVAELQPAHHAMVEEKYSKAVNRIIADNREKLMNGCVSDRLSDNSDFINSAFIVLYENYLSGVMPFDIVGYEYTHNTVNDRCVISFMDSDVKMYDINGVQTSARLVNKMYRETANGYKVALSASKYSTLYAVSDTEIIAKRTVTPFLLAMRKVNAMINGNCRLSAKETGLPAINNYSTDNFEIWQKQLESDNFINQIMDGLTEVQALYLNDFLNGSSYTDIARRYGKSADTVRTIINRIVSKLYGVAVEYIN